MTDWPGTAGAFAGKRASAAVRDEAEALSSALPPLLVAADRLASAVSLGVHGRRKAGPGETFWQFRRYSPEDPSGLIDWRQSGKSQHVFVREREWEAAEVVWFWRDGSEGMQFRSNADVQTKFARANLLALALANLLARGGERVGYLGEARAPASGRTALTRLAQTLVDLAPQNSPLPSDAPVGKSAQLVWFSDFFAPVSDIEGLVRRFAAQGLKGSLVQIVDPAEEEFPYSGRTRFEKGRENVLFGRAESVRSQYRARFRAQCETVSVIARRLGFSHMMHRTDRRPEIALIALYAELAGPRAKLRA